MRNKSSLGLFSLTNCCIELLSWITARRETKVLHCFEHPLGNEVMLNIKRLFYVTDGNHVLPQARGIDVQQVSLVINYDLPTNRENYIHR